MLANFPSYQEQTKIANFLTAVDDKIDNLSKTLDSFKDYKKGMMQRIFSQEIRFKDEDGKDFSAWVEKRLRDVSFKKSQKNKKLTFNTVLSNSAVQGIIKQSSFFDKNIAQKSSLDAYYIVEDGDFVYNPRISRYAPVGPIHLNKLNYTGIVSPLYTVFSINKSRYHLGFFEYFFKNHSWYSYMRSIANYGARHDRMNIKIDDFFAMPILMPILKEQTKIANFLSAIDEKIDNLTASLGSWKLFKKSLLQKMFV